MSSWPILTIGTDSENLEKKISDFFEKSRFFAHFDPCLARNAKVIIWRVEYGPTLRAYVEKVGWSGENLKIEKHSSNDAKKKLCLDFYLRAASSSNPASKIAKIAVLANFTLGGILNICAATFQIALARSQMHSFRRFFFYERGESKFSFKKKN